MKQRSFYPFIIRSIVFFIFIQFVTLALLFGGNIPEFTAPYQSYSDMHWRMIGPFRAGRALAACGIPGNASTFYFGAVDGGIWKTTNAGLTWRPISDGQINPSIGALAISPANDQIIYVGTGESDMRSDITYGGGMYKSTDGGEHWMFIGLKDTRHIGKILIDPHNPDLVLVAAVGHAYGANEERGVFRTTNGGKSWQKVLYKNPETGAVDLAWDPKNPQIVYASLWQMRRVPWDQYQPVEGDGSGLYKSEDEGKTWKELKGHGLPAGPFGRIGIAVAKGSGGRILFVLVSTRNNGSGLYRSDDGGASWRFVNNDRRITSRMWYFGRVFLDPRNPDIVYIPSQGLLRSTDGGKSFTVIKSSPGGDDYHYLWIDPENSDRMIVASDQGTVLSLDNGRTWSSWYNQPTGQFYHVITDNQFPYRVYGAQQDAGTVSITSRSDYGEITFRDWYSVGAGESGYIAPDPQNADIVFGGGTYGSIRRFDRVTGQYQVISPWPLRSFGQPIAKQKYRFSWTSPIIFDRHDPKSLYFGAQVLLRTRDGGLHWQEISPDLTGARPDQQSASGPLTIANASARGWGVIYTIAPSRLKQGLIWVGTDDGLVQITKDGGRRWQNVTPPGLQPWSKISLIEDSPFDAGTAYVAVDRHRLDDFTPVIYKTVDYGAHWQRIDEGISAASYVHVVRADPVRKGLLYAGTETGVFVSFDDGEHWQSLQLNLPMVAVRDLAIQDNDLIAATHGRAFWILDDLTPLQQLNAEILHAPAHLYRPERAIRIRHSVNTDTPLPPEIPHGDNPPRGAIIDYNLNSHTGSEVALDILDASGALIRHFSSEDKPHTPAGQVYFMEEWLPRFEPLTTHLGHNRFVWDLHYPTPPTKFISYSMAANAGRGTVIRPRGPLVLPGEYNLRLTIGGRSYTRPIIVEMDPRVHISVAALQKQLKLALQIWNAMAEQNTIDLAVQKMQKNLKNLQQKYKLSMKTKRVVKTLDRKIESFGAFLNDGGLARLETAVMSADREPTQQMQDAFNMLQMKLTEVKQQWLDINSKDLNMLNGRLKKEGMSTIKTFPLSAKQLAIPDVKK